MRIETSGGAGEGKLTAPRGTRVKHPLVTAQDTGQLHYLRPKCTEEDLGF